MSTVTKRQVGIDKYIARFNDAMKRAAETIVAAAKIYAEAVDANPDNAKIFHDRCSYVHPDRWHELYLIGSGKMHPALADGGGPNASHIRRLEYADQKRIMEGETVELLTTDGETLMVDLRTATGPQVRQVVNNNHLRSLGEQRAWLESRNKGPKYEVKGDKLEVYGRCTFSKAALLRIVAEKM